ncbi:MAG TPA: D-alanyl-D-alanine carboxypeptidase/D-alanyl-D-alanine-endopeptidase [Kofleriaceae bacterium]|nr:D-alanyl-D-alanine carboxypeptidase/D-alanyl-D-alanine-endopeptidase [Kofleriaceae bacterium]
MPTRRCTRAGAALALSVLLVGACSGGLSVPGDDDGDGVTDGDGADDAGDDIGEDGLGGDGEAPVEPDEFEPPPAPLALPDEAIAAAADAIRGVVASTAFTHSVLVENGTTGQVVADVDGGTLLKPASNTKLYTTAAAMELLGEDHPLTTRIAASAEPGADGVIDGDLTIALEHDFSLSSDLYDGPRVPLDRIAQALVARGVTGVTGTVNVTGESVFEANSVGYLDVATERTQTTDAMGAALSAAGITAGAVVSGTALEPPDGAIELFEHTPITLGIGTSPLNTDSNNEFADLLIRHIGWRLEGESSAAAGTRAVLEWLPSMGVATDGLALNDGSGLSHDNRVSARSTVALLGAMDASPVGATWTRTLAIAGVRGTMGSRLTGADTAGRVFAKTGSLRDTIALSGYLENRHDGQRYRFSILWNAVTDAAAARGLADDIVAVVARDLRGTGGARPAAPELLYTGATGTAGVLEIAWRAVDAVDGYLVWLSEDGRAWSRSQARYVRGTHFLAGDLPAGRPTYVRVTARAADGMESDPSCAYGATASDERARVLLVDGNDRWLAQPSPENVLTRNHDFLAGLAAAAGDRPVASAHHGAIERGELDLGGFDLVVWAAGEESTMNVALSPDERAALAAHLTAGGGLILSGAELIWALADQGDGDERAFAADVLGTGYVADDASTYEAEGAPGSPFAALPLFSFLAPDGMDINFPDVLAPGEGIELVRYVGGTGGAAVVGFPADSGRRLVVTGFPIEALPSAAVRAQLLGAALDFLE